MKTGMTETALLPEYGKRKLLLYAQSFEELAKTFTEIPQEETLQQDRQTSLWQRRFHENRELLAEHLKEAAQIMEQVAQESFSFVALEDKQKRRLVHAFKEQGIELKDIFLMEDGEERLRLGITMKSRKEEVFTIEEIADFLSVLFERRLLAEKNSIFFLRDTFETVVFEEEARYGILTGTARAIKENEKISGDNYTILEAQNGRALMALSDGMGSGEKACRDSQLVIELLEKCIETGFSEETSIEMINGVLIARAEEENMSTLDICDVDLYTGNVKLIKIGSAYTYIKREDWVEQIASNTLPMGLFQKPEVEVCERKLTEGDYIIMLSDGIVDSIQADNRDEILREVIAALNSKNSRELANNILQFAIHQSGGRIQDDMTVLVMGLWEND